MQPHETVHAIPLWVGGRACLKLAPVFRDVINPVTGLILRRIPLCGSGDVEEALQSARSGLGAWQSLGGNGRLLLLAALGDALRALSGHFSALVAEETGQQPSQADEEVARLVALLRAPSAGAVDGVGGVAVVSGASKSLVAVAGPAVSALAAGATLLVCPAPESPSALFALAELSGRCGFPPGVINVVYPNGEALAHLRSVAGVTVLP